MDVIASIESINQAIKEYTFGQKPRELYQPMQYIMGLDQKRLYPLLTLWGCYLFSGETSKALKPALGIEVFHNFLKVHEDILDRNTTRNHRESVHVKWNDNVAILSGDAMIFKAYELLIQVDTSLIKPVVNMFNHCFTQVCEGKQLALNNPEVANSLEIINLNPGALASFSLKLGATIGGAVRGQVDQTANLGHALNIFWSNGNDRSFPSFEELDSDEEKKQQFKSWAMSVGVGDEL